jgi:hypothetical protein
MKKIFFISLFLLFLMPIPLLAMVTASDEDEPRENISAATYTSQKFSKDLSNETEAKDYRQTTSYLSLLSAKVLLQWTILEPETLIPTLLTSRFIPKAIDNFMGNTYLGSFFKGAYYAANFSLLTYYAFMDPGTFILSYGASWLAENITNVVDNKRLVKSKEILGALLFILEEAGKFMGHSFKSENSTTLVKDMMSSGLQSFILEHRQNGTCPALSTLHSNGCDIPCSSSSNIFSCNLQLPPAYCIAFEKEEINRLSLIMARELIKDFSLQKDMPFAIIVGEKHNKVSDFLVELGLLNLAHSMGIRHLLIELPSLGYEEIQRRALASSFSALDTPLIYKKIKMATYLGMEVIPIDLPNRVSSLRATTICTTMEAIFNQEREAGFCHRMLNFKYSFIAFLGHLHPSYFPNRCKGMNEAHAISYFHLQSRETKEKISQTLKAFSTCNRYIYDRYQESISFLNDRQVTFISLKASDLLEPQKLLNFFIGGIINPEELSQQFLELSDTQ